MRACSRVGGRARTLLAALCVLVPASAGAQNWPSFRGPSASGVGTGAPPASWDLGRSTNVAWTVPIPGLAHSSPVVWGDRIYVTTAVAESGPARVVTGDSSVAGIDSARDQGPHTWRLIAVDRASGRIAFDRAVHSGVPRMKRHVKASHASATPATDGRVIVAFLGSEGLFCFDMNGEFKWRQDLGVMDVGLVDDPTYQWGPASSPVIAGEMVIVQNDRHKDSFVAAYDLLSGKELWRSAHDDYPSWATPAVVSGAQGPVVVTNAGKFIRGLEARTGRELWRFADNQTQVKVPTPVAVNDLVIVTGGYPAGGRPIYAFKPDGRGELGPQALAWRTDRGSPYTGTPLVYDGLLYVCTDNGILSAYDPVTGARIYQQRVSPAAAGFSASPVAAAGRIYLASEDGDVFVVRAGRTFELLATNRMGEVLMATPALTGDMIVVRTQTKLVGIAARG
ncbi:MAG: PQQ-binding-like beta-propeller repeat protein [Vicinamibacterales bacterium]